VFTALKSVSVGSLDGSDITAIVTFRDNDIYSGTIKTEADLAALIEVKATYTAYNDTSKQAIPTLTYDPDYYPAEGGNALKYTMSGFPTTKLDVEAGEDYQVGAGGTIKNGKATNVVVTHNVVEGYGVLNPQTKSAKQKVTWTW